MPNSLVISFAKKSKKSVSEVEKLWKSAVDIVKKEYKAKESDKKFYPLVVGVLKKSLGINQEEISFLDFLQEKKLLETVSKEKKFDNTIALVAGSFKPPHFAHLYMVMEYAKLADKVIIIISNPKSEKSLRKTKLGTVITPEMAKKIWEIYLRKYGLSNKVEVVISPSPSPVGAMFDYIDNNIENSNVILGVSKKGDDLSRFKSVEKVYADNEKVHILDPKEYAVEPFKSKGKEVSATDIRNNIDNFEKVKELLPNKLSDNDIKSIMKILKA